MSARYSLEAVPVRGGELAVGVWAGDGPTVLALHGITAHHQGWPVLAEALPDHRILAPDLRGRGRSSALPGAWGMAQHAADAAAVLTALASGPVVVVGHSMGAFVALVLADRHPELVERMVLVDGGLPFAPAEQSTTEAALAAIRARLEARFPDEDAYVDLFRQHPAFAHDWSSAAEGYARYDAVRTEDGQVRSSADLEAVLADQDDVLHGDALRSALAGLGPDSVPTTFLHAPRGFADDPPGLYAPETVRDLAEQLPHLRMQRVDDVNHYTIVLSERGARAVAEAVTGQ